MIRERVGKFRTRSILRWFLGATIAALGFSIAVEPIGIVVRMAADLQIAIVHYALICITAGIALMIFDWRKPMIGVLSMPMVIYITFSFTEAIANPLIPLHVPILYGSSYLSYLLTLTGLPPDD